MKGQAHAFASHHPFVILALYVILGVLYAVRTPAWQAPMSRPTTTMCGSSQRPVIFLCCRWADYPHGYMEEIKSRKFPPDLSIDPIRYEFHQPPLYYIRWRRSMPRCGAPCCRCDWPRVARRGHLAAGLCDGSAHLS